jgi:biopolymer transport protein ExbD
MNFYVRKRKQTPTVIIVALIDVLIVLLIFLMVTTTFKQQPSLRLALPESSQSQKSGANENAPLVVSIKKDGTLLFGPDARAVTPEQLSAELAAKAAANPEIKLAISADENAPFGRIVKVMDAAKASKIKTVNAFTREAKP